MADLKKYLSLERLAEYDALLKQDYEGKIAAAVAGKADSEHNHDDAYYTQEQIDTALLGKADSDHNHDDVYVKADDVSTAISAHNTDADAHSDIRGAISDLSTQVNNFLDVDDATKDQLSEVLALIAANKGTLDSITTNKVNTSDIVDNLTTAESAKVLSANQGVVLKTLIDTKADGAHGHGIDDISGLSDALAGKVAQDDFDSAILAVNANAANQDAVVLAEAQAYTDGKIEVVAGEIAGNGELIAKHDKRITAVEGLTIDKIDTIDFDNGEPQVTIEEDGTVYWEMLCGLNDNTTTFDANFRLPIVAGDNVSFAVDESGMAVAINAAFEEITSDEISALFNPTTT